MACLQPIRAYRSRERHPETGRYLISFNPHRSLVEGSSLTVPCNKCVGCRLDRSVQLATRAYHESQMWPANSFLTLTYDDKHLPDDYSVDLDEYQRFLKRLRKSLQPQTVRFLGVGEYGDENLRPHYHFIIFNYRPGDLKFFKFSQSGDPIFTSESLSTIWPYGQAWVGSVTYKSAAYCARYCFKKMGGDVAATHYVRQHPLTGLLHQVEPEFCTWSRRPGLGSTWFEKFKSDAFPSDFVIVDRRRAPVPRYYLKKLTEEESQPIKRARKRKSLKSRADQTRERLKVRSEVLESKLKQLKRTL